MRDVAYEYAWRQTRILGHANRMKESFETNAEEAARLRKNLLGEKQHLFLFSSLSETQGIVLLEAMAAATPVFALKASGIRDIVVDGRNGYMTYVSETEYENRLDDLLRQDRAYLEKGALETAKKYEMREIARRAAVYYNRTKRIPNAVKDTA